MNKSDSQKKRDQCKPKKRMINKCIGIIIKDFYPSYSSIVSGVKQYAKEKGYSVITMSSDNDYECEKKLSDLISLREADGVIIAPVQENISEIEHLFKLKMINYPFVLLEDVKGIQANVVTVDYANAIKLAVKYLIDNGHIKVVHFTDSHHSYHTNERIEGFREAFGESNLVFKEDEMIISIGSRYNESFNKILKYFKNKNKMDYPSAIFCFNDYQAFAVFNALKEMNIRVPDDISVIGSDDIYYAKNYSLPLTTIKAPLNEMGKKAAEILIRNIQSAEVLSEEKVVFNAELIIRETTKKIRYSYY